MMRGMYSAISGLKNHQVMLDVTANDLANVNTIGFKASRTSFRDSLSQLQRSASAATAGFGGNNSAQVGLGVQLGSIDNIMTSGATQSTGSPYDVAIQGTGWFRVSDSDPTAAGFPANVEFTRAGNFTLNNDGDLTTQDGWRVIGFTADAAGDPTTTQGVINVPNGSSDVAVGTNGAVSYVPNGGGSRVTAGYLSLATFANEAGLNRASANRWQATPSSGAESTPDIPTQNGRGSTVGGVLEMSNVDLAAEFTNMITAQRGFEASSRVLSTADEMLQTIVNMKH
jgi:flagellar hook protein FlgE